MESLNLNYWISILFPIHHKWISCKELAPNYFLIEAERTRKVFNRHTSVTRVRFTGGGKFWREFPGATKVSDSSIIYWLEEVQRQKCQKNQKIIVQV